MPGRNLFGAARRFTESLAPDKPCIFISHRKADIAEARELARAIIAAGLNIYFDERDKCLAGASEKRNPQQVARCIDAGLLACTHLLGLITARTRGSWWVPYEIGATRARERECAFLIHPEVTKLPAYIQVAATLKDREELKAWLPPLPGRTARARRLLDDLCETLLLANGPNFLPPKRTTPLRYE